MSFACNAHTKNNNVVAPVQAIMMSRSIPHQRRPGPGVAVADPQPEVNGMDGGGGGGWPKKRDSKQVVSYLKMRIISGLHHHPVVVSAFLLSTRNI